MKGSTKDEDTTQGGKGKAQENVCLRSILECDDHAHVAIFCCHQPEEMHLRHVYNDIKTNVAVFLPGPDTLGTQRSLRRDVGPAGATRFLRFLSRLAGPSCYDAGAFMPSWTCQVTVYMLITCIACNHAWLPQSHSARGVHLDTVCASTGLPHASR